MTPAARLSAAIKVLDIYLGGQAVEKALTNWARRSRFAGSKDRAAIRDIVFDCLRKRKSYAEYGNGETGRGLVCAHASIGRELPEVEALFSGERHAPAPLSKDEIDTLFNTQFRQSWEMMFDMPNWLAGELSTSLGDDDIAVARALTERAPMFLRVSQSRFSRDEAIAALAKDGVAAVAVPAVETALEVTENPRKVAASAAYSSGMVEVQDASSQAICIGLPPAARMLDYCAGGGGKVLAYGELNSAQLYAHDANPGRLKDLKPRADRAGLSVRVLDKKGCRAQAPFELVLCDVPCSGSGAWRRTPEGKWALTPDRLSELHKSQAQILDETAGLVSEGGCLAYVTCSIFQSENSQQIQSFLKRNSSYTLSEEIQYLPGDGGDGLYVAHLTRQGSAA